MNLQSVEWGSARMRKPIRRMAPMMIGMGYGGDGSRFRASRSTGTGTRRKAGRSAEPLPGGVLRATGPSPPPCAALARPGRRPPQGRRCAMDRGSGGSAGLAERQALNGAHRTRSSATGEGCGRPAPTSLRACGCVVDSGACGQDSVSLATGPSGPTPALRGPSSLGVPTGRAQGAAPAEAAFQPCRAFRLLPGRPARQVPPRRSMIGGMHPGRSARAETA